MRLTDLVLEKQELQQELFLSGGEIDPLRESLLEKLDQEEQKELTNLAFQIQKIREEKAAINGRITYLKEQIAEREKDLAGLEAREAKTLAIAAQAVPKHVPVETGEGTFQWFPSVAVEVDESVEVKKLPERFISYKEEYKPDKRELRKALEAGEFSHPGIELRQTWRLKLK